jgi:prepilin-type N-terminal cleavage/methylation domain-containing protein
MSLTATPRRLAGGARHGMTMIELMFVVVLLGLVLSAMLSVINRQQRFYRSAGDLLKQRSQLRQALAQLPADLRAVSAVGGDIYAWSDKSIEFRSFSGQSVACTISATRDTLYLPTDAVLPRKNTLTSWSSTPVTGDSVFVYDDGASVGNSDDSWKAYKIVSMTRPLTPVGCNPTALLSAQLDSGMTTSWRMVVTPAISASIMPASPVRFFRRVHYELYQASNNLWYLGAYDCLSTYASNGNCGTLTPVSGPYNSYSNAPNNANGIAFTYFDSTGTALTPAPGQTTRIAQIMITARAQASGTTIAGRASGSTPDSMSVYVGIRNRY